VDGDRSGRRRRRGRRGGRGRVRREDDQVERPNEASADRRDAAPSDGFRGSSVHSDDAWEIRDSRRTDDIRDSRRTDHTNDEGSSESRSDAGESGERQGEKSVQGDDDSRPRRRRRGRRGGRGRRRDSEDGARGEAASGDTPARGPSTAGEGDDEPLPTSYGMRPRSSGPARGEGSRTDRPAEAKEGEEAAGSEGRGRRRRRRRGGEGRSRSDRESSSSSSASSSSASNRDSGQSRPRSRSGRRSTGESRSSSFSRGRRDDFAPVAGRHDDDDEGLEFLGVEEAGQESSRRQRAAEDEDILVESGLNSVLDVPSWVEAIGIVIAGNLDARNKARSGDRSR